MNEPSLKSRGLCPVSLTVRPSGTRDAPLVYVCNRLDRLDALKCAHGSEEDAMIAMLDIPDTCERQWAFRRQECSPGGARPPNAMIDVGPAFGKTPQIGDYEQKTHSAWRRALKRV